MKAQIKRALANAAYYKATGTYPIFWQKKDIKILDAFIKANS